MEYSPTQPNDLSLDGSSVVQEIISLIQGGQSFLLTSHLRPDGDAIGSVIGLTRSLRKAGKLADIMFHDSPPDRFAYLLEGETVLKPEILPRTYDTVLVLDSSTQSFTGFDDFLSATTSILVNIDHHSSNEEFGDLNFVDREACSTCEVIFQLIQQTALPMDPDIAEPLFLGLMTDTRFFQNENIRASAYFAAGQLVETGLKTSLVLGRLTRSRKLPELRVLGFGLSSFQTFCDGKVAVLKMTQSDLRSCDALLEHIWSCGIFGQLVSLEGIIASVSILQDKEKCYAEFRSNSGFNVRNIALEFGGGGHLAASGCNSDAPFDEFSERVIGKLVSQMNSWSQE